MGKAVPKRIIDLEWPTRYLLECGHAVAIAANASAADMAMPGQMLPCPDCGGTRPAAPQPLVTRFKAGEPINAMTLNNRLAEIEACLARRGTTAQLTRFAATEPLNATTLNARLDEIDQLLR